MIVVFTKYDILVNEQKRKDQNKPKQEQLFPAQLEEKAEACFNDRIKFLKTPMEVSMVKVSTSEAYQRLSSFYSQLRTFKYQLTFR